MRVQNGAIWDVIVDPRAEWPTFSSWYGAELNDENALALYVPKGFAHGFITLANDTTVYYQVSTRYSSELERGVRWNDPDIGIQSPLMPAVISDRDRTLPALKELTVQSRS